MSIITFTTLADGKRSWMRTPAMRPRLLMTAKAVRPARASRKRMAAAIALAEGYARAVLALPARAGATAGPGVAAALTAAGTKQRPSAAGVSASVMRLTTTRRAADGRSVPLRLRHDRAR